MGRDTSYTHWQVNDPVTGLESTAGSQLRPRMGAGLCNVPPGLGYRDGGLVDIANVSMPKGGG